MEKYPNSFLDLLLFVLNECFLIVHLFEALQPSIWSSTSSPCNQIGPQNFSSFHLTYTHLLIPLESESRSFLKTFLVCQGPFKVVNAMKKLTSLSIHAETLFMELSAEFSLEVGGNMGLSLEFILAMSVGAGFSKFTLAIYFKVPAKLCFFLYLI